MTSPASAVAEIERSARSLRSTPSTVTSPAVVVAGTIDLREHSQKVSVKETERGDVRVNGRLQSTARGAYAAFEEEDKGSLEPGKLADFVVLSSDIMTVPAPEILKTRVVMTVLGGEIVHPAR